MKSKSNEPTSPGRSFALGFEPADWKTDGPLHENVASLPDEGLTALIFQCSFPLSLVFFSGIMLLFLAGKTTFTTKRQQRERFKQKILDGHLLLLASLYGVNIM